MQPSPSNTISVSNDELNRQPTKTHPFVRSVQSTGWCLNPTRLYVHMVCKQPPACRCVYCRRCKCDSRAQRNALHALFTRDCASCVVSPRAHARFKFIAGELMDSRRSTCLAAFTSCVCPLRVSHIGETKKSKLNVARLSAEPKTPTDARFTCA